MAKSKWFKVVRTIQAEFEYKGRVIPTTIQAGSLIEIGRHAAQVLLPNGDIRWGLTTIPAADLRRSRG